jgi:predicted TIM-barrel fold metal-dependent hydrolase
MFESNFPVEKRVNSYVTVWNAFKRMTQSYSAVERQALFHDTATRVYRLATAAKPSTTEPRTKR